MARRGLTILLVLCLLLTGCSQSGAEATAAAEQTEAGQAQTPSGEQADVLLTVGEETLPLKIAQAFAVSQKHQYESAFGSSIWQVAYLGGSFEDYLRDGFRTHIALYFASACMAKVRGVSLGSEEEKTVREAGKAFYDALDAKDRELLGLTQQDAEELFRMYLLAKKVYKDVTGSVELELSEDETRMIRLQEIRLRTDDLDSAGKDQKLTLAAEALTQLEAGESFDAVAEKYSETGSGVYTASRESLSSAEARVAFALATDEVSPVVTLPNAYVIFKCVDSFDKQASALHRMELLQQMEDTGFKEQLNLFLNDHPLRWSEAAWAKIRISDYAGPAAASLYAVYEEYFGEE